MTDVSALLKTLGFADIRLEGEDEWQTLNGQFKGETTDTLDVILRPNDRDGIAHIRKGGDTLAVARK